MFFPDEMDRLSKLQQTASEMGDPHFHSLGHVCSHLLTVSPFSSSHRGEIHKIIFDHAINQGVDIRLGQQVTEYFENDKEAGVISNGERIVGDVVLGADGVRSKARQLVLGYDDKPKPSGYAIYRAWMSSEELAKNDLTKDLVIHGDTHTGW